MDDWARMCHPNKKKSIFISLSIFNIILIILIIIINIIIYY